MQDWKSVLMFLGGLVAVVWLLSDGERSSRAEEILRTQFHIPESAEFTKSRHPRKGSAYRIEGIVEFTEAQYAAYISKLDDPEIWKAQSYTFGWTTIDPPFAPGALAWNELPAVYFAGATAPRFGYLSKDVATNVESGRAFCLALRFPRGQRKASWTRRVRKGDEHLWPVETPAALDHFNGVACNQLGRNEMPQYILYGVLDAKTRTLHMIID